VSTAIWFAALLALRGAPADDRRAACMARNEGAPQRYQGLVRALCADHHNLGGVGASVAVGEGGALRFVATAGERCLGGAPVVADTGFRLGSLTKLMTAALVLTLVDRGKLGLDAPLVSALPELEAWIDPRAAQISMRQLLGHTAGLGEVSPRELPGEEWREALAERPLWTPPGALWSYSNAGYGLVGEVIERVAGEDYATALQRRVLGPLGVRVTTEPTVALTMDAACGHLGRGGRALALDVRDDVAIGAGGARWTTPAGGAIASAGELARFVLGVIDPLGSPLSAGAIAELLGAGAPTYERPGESYALGLRVQRLAGGEALYVHSGNTGDFAAELVVAPARGFVLVLLSNTGDPLQGTAAAGLKELLGVEGRRAGAHAELERYAGRYAIAGGAVVTVRVEREGLMIDGVRGEHAGDDRFRVGGAALSFVFADGSRMATYLRGPGYVARRSFAAE
jgi:CubicO group peptidase (beta-lactamase class C family)